MVRKRTTRAENSSRFQAVRW